jgi:GAF domain-containing protein
MAEELIIPTSSSRAEVYDALFPQMKALVDGEPNFVANLANIAAAIRQSVPFLWVGFYLVENDVLVLGPFQGPIACTRIKKGKGVCGSSWAENKTLVVPDVELFPGHIACSSASRSEIVVPLRTASGAVMGVLDVDSVELNDFSEVDQLFFEKVSALITHLCGRED